MDDCVIPSSLLLFFCLPPDIGAQKVRVDDELEAYPTESVELHCQFVDGGGRTKLTQVGRRGRSFVFLAGLKALKLRMLKTD